MTTFWQLGRSALIGTLVSRDSESAVHLGPGEVLFLSGDRRNWQIVCAAGQLWITQAGDTSDYLLRQGQQFRISKPGAIVVQGMPHGQVRVIA